MKVDSKSKKVKKNIPILISISVIIIMSLFLISIPPDGSYYLNDTTKKTTKTNTLNSPTNLGLLQQDLTTFFNNKDYKVYQKNDFSIYVSGLDKLDITYVYKGIVNLRELNDRFFLEIHLNDSLKTKTKKSMVTMSYIKRPKVVDIEGELYTVFQNGVYSNQYIDNNIPREEIHHINIARFTPGKGRSLDLKDVKLKEITPLSSNDIKNKITLKVDQKDFDKILTKRELALTKGVLITENDDIIDGKVSSNGGEFKKMEFRLKGDWTDHLVDEKKWSYRVIVKGGETLYGMRKFSIQHPKVRNFLWEWLFNKVLKDENIIGLRYDFAQVTLEIKDKDTIQNNNLGIMAIEETFDKILIEHNKKREGVILAFDESQHWLDEERITHWKLDDKARSPKIAQLPNAPIKVFNQNKVLADPKLKEQFKVAKNLLESVRKGKLKISEVYDMDKLSTFVALSNLYGGQHGLAWHNIRIYYNPITNKLEPISYDSHSGIKLTRIRHYPMSDNDPVYKEKVLEKLKLVTEASYIKKMLSSYQTPLEDLKKQLKTEFRSVFDQKILEYNSNFIKNKINPAIIINAHLIDYNDQEFKLHINNLSEHMVTLNGLYHKDGRKLSVDLNKEKLAPNQAHTINFKLDTYFSNAFVSKKNKKGSLEFPKDIEKIYVTHHINGVNFNRNANIIPYAEQDNPTQITKLYKNSQVGNIDQYKFIDQVSEHKLIFKEGNYVITEDIVIPRFYEVHISPGFTLDLKNNANIKSESVFKSEGTADKPIKFYSSDGTGAGIFINNVPERSTVNYTTFDNLSNPHSDIWSVSGAVNFHESDVTISHSIFSNNRCEDALNIIRSTFEMTDSTFKNTYSDAFDGDFVEGTIQRCVFNSPGNDGIDISGSTLTLDEIKINNPSDKGISAGENSSIAGANISISGGEVDSKLIIDKVAVNTVSNKVIDQMYGKEYGKSSR